MSEFWTAALVLGILLGSAAGGLRLQGALSEQHKSREMRELSQVVTGMLVTLAALVLGLLTSSVVQSFNGAASRLDAYASELIGLSQSLEEVGADAEPARALLRSYVANAIASTWPDEPRPPGTATLGSLQPDAQPHAALESTTLGAVLERVGRELRRLAPGDAVRGEVAAKAVRQFDQLVQDRWAMLEGTRSSIPLPFFRLLVFWLTIVFVSLGLIAPRNVLALVMLVLAAVAIASAIFAILEMDRPFTGLISVPSSPMRDALAHLSRPAAGGAVLSR